MYGRITKCEVSLTAHHGKSIARDT